LRALAQLAGTSASRLSNYENAKVAPTTDVLGRIEHVIAMHVARASSRRSEPGAGRRHSRGRVAPECQGREISAVVLGSAVALEWPVALGSPEAPRPPRSMVPPCGC